MNIKTAWKVGAVAVASIGLLGILLLFLQPKTEAPTPTLTNYTQPAPLKTESSGVIPETPHSAVDWKNVTFDSCGASNKYEKMSWWGQFRAQIEKIPYYSAGYIHYQLQAAEKEPYLNPNKKKYTYESYCADTNYSDASICGEEKKRTLTMSDLQEYGEGCLAQDGSAFIALFPGEYVGGGNFIVRYDIKGDVLEVGKRIREDERDSFFSIPPQEFGKRSGTIIKITGLGGDAGCGGTADYDYNLVTNTISLVKSCSGCGRVEEWKSCKTY